MKVYVAIPCLDHISAKFVQCVLNLKAPKDTELIYDLNVGTLVYHSRNELAERAISSKAEYTLWLDADMTFMPYTLIDMLNTLRDNNLDILCGMYYRRRHPWTPTLFSRFDIIDKAGIRSEEFTEIPEGLFEVAACGFGCVLMRTSVLMTVLVSQGPQFTPIGQVGEDISFCVRARKCHYKVWCDPSIALGHEVHTVITKSNREMFRNGNDVKTQRLAERDYQI